MKDADPSIACSNILELPDHVLRQCLEFHGPNCYRYLAGTCRAFRKTYIAIAREKRTTSCQNIFASTSCYRVFEEECKSGHPTYLLQSRQDLFTLQNGKLSIIGSQHAKEAAKVGNVECLEYICDQMDDCDVHGERKGHFWKQIAYIAARSGHLACLQYATEQSHHCIQTPSWMDEDTFKEAARGGHFACLKFLFENVGWNGRMNTRFLAKAAAEGGSTDCLEFIHVKGVDVSHCAFWAAKRGNLNCLRYLMEAGFYIAPACAAVAERKGHVECLEYLHENGIRARDSGRMEIIVKTMGNRVIPCYVESSDLIRSLKRMIREHEGMAEDQQRLLVAGGIAGLPPQWLLDDDTFSQYGIQSGDTIYLVRQRIIL